MESPSFPLRFHWSRIYFDFVRYGLRVLGSGCFPRFPFWGVLGLVVAADSCGGLGSRGAVEVEGLGLGWEVAVGICGVFGVGLAGDFCGGRVEGDNVPGLAVGGQLEDLRRGRRRFRYIPARLW